MEEKKAAQKRKIGDRREADYKKHAQNARSSNQNKIFRFPISSTTIYLRCRVFSHLLNQRNSLKLQKQLVLCTKGVLYKVSQRFGRHVDESVDLGEGMHTQYSLLIYLNGGTKSKTKSDLQSPEDSSSDPLVGRETVFYDSKNGVVAEVSPTEGMALLHMHEDKCMLHEA
ncbi:2-oxoglutarate (2OG) and Fe(II)-dependent oxygenase superfamily protein [Quillaja saponaria]|uniref:2-oxoglutarate (2OG) and Fe(II)-dependent oxygenase superfamily protein n=1 Tax=Quillaja saponaria TaxID=32244 RepID=A0AAD7Q6C3_QUISA|nr:2-oxoglutarate (2OG) and Fe(II)-dependent oxygenase superfamily protein [Quillaja saponaria]